MYTYLSIIRKNCSILFIDFMKKKRYHVSCNIWIVQFSAYIIKYVYSLGMRWNVRLKFPVTFIQLSFLGVLIRIYHFNYPRLCTETKLHNTINRNDSSRYAHILSTNISSLQEQLSTFRAYYKQNCKSPLSYPSWKKKRMQTT